MSDTKTATARREWWGWFGCMAWQFCMINTYSEFWWHYTEKHFTGYITAFQVIFAASVVTVGFLFGRDPNRLGKLAFYATPVAFVIPAVLSFFPPPTCSVLFILSPIFIAPATARRAYGIVRTAPPDRMLMRFMSSSAAAYGFMLVFINMVCTDGSVKVVTGEPSEVTFAITSVFALVAWFGVRRSVGGTTYAQDKTGQRFSKLLLAGTIAVILVSCWMRVLNNIIDYSVEQYDQYLLFPVYSVMPPLAFILFGYLGDKGRGHERKNILGGLILFLISIQLAFLVFDIHDLAAIPLVIVNHLIHIYVMYFILTLPLSFFKDSNRPVFIASLSMGLYLFQRVFSRAVGEFLPESMQEAGVPLLVITAITAIVFFLLLYFIFRRQREKTLAAALYALLHSGPEDKQPEPGEAPQPDRMDALSLTEGEKKVALLLTEGLT